MARNLYFYCKSLDFNSTEMDDDATRNCLSYRAGIIFLFYFIVICSSYWPTITA